jgi:hypothetical protein
MCRPQEASLCGFISDWPVVSATTEFFRKLVISSVSTGMLYQTNECMRRLQKAILCNLNSFQSSVTVEVPCESSIIHIYCTEIVVE